MPIDYSKWDKLELSDDSDVEVHPNVDKASFVRWKQQSIHEERAKRNQDIKTLEAQMTMYENLNKRTDNMLKNMPLSEFGSLENIVKYLNSNFDKSERSEGEYVDKDIPTYNEMVEDLIEQLQKELKEANKDPTDGSLIVHKLAEHRLKIQTVMNEGKIKLAKLYEEKANHISADDMHDAWNSSFVNKSGKTVAPSVGAPDVAGTTTSSSASAANFQNPPISQTLPSSVKSFISFDAEEDILKLDPKTKAFGEIPASDFKKSQQFLLENMEILSDQQKDALIMSAFEYEMEGDTKKCYQVIHQGELMQFIKELYDLKKIPYLHTSEMENIINNFFERIFFNTQNEMGKKQFLQSVQTKYDHIRTRSKILQEQDARAIGEDESEGVETIQLKSLDDTVQLKINLPDFESTDPNEQLKVSKFNELSPEMQNAVKTESLDVINDVLSRMSVSEGEKVLEIFDQADIIGINAYFDNEKDFEELQETYQEQMTQADQGELSAADQDDLD